MKWKSLRDFFKKLIRKRGIKDIDDYLGRWRYFKAMWFLYKPEMTHKDDDSCEELTNTSTDNMVKCEPIDVNETELSMDEQDPIPDKKRRTNNEDDFDLMFLKSLTPFLKQLEPIRKLVVRSKIQEILLNEIAAQSTGSKNFY